MDTLTSIPVRVHAEPIPSILVSVTKRIAHRAYERFLDRGSVDGHSFEDWISAERELIVRLAPEISVNEQDITIEVLLPTHDMPDVAVHIAPRQCLLASGIDEAGLQICQVIDLPYDISMDGVDAEQYGNTIRITAALA